MKYKKNIKTEEREIYRRHPAAFTAAAAVSGFIFLAAAVFFGAAYFLP